MQTTRLFMGAGSLALVAAALTLLVRKQETTVPENALDEMRGVSKEISSLRAQVRALRRELREQPQATRVVAPSTAAKREPDEPEEPDEPDEPMAVPVSEEERLAAAEAAEHEQTQQRIDRLQNRALTEPLDREATQETEEMLETILVEKALTRVHLENVSCFESMCSAQVGFDSLEQRNTDLFAVLDGLKVSNFAHIEDGESLSGEIYLARGEGDADIEGWADPE